MKTETEMICSTLYNNKTIRSFVRACTTCIVSGFCTTVLLHVHYTYYELFSGISFYQSFRSRFTSIIMPSFKQSQLYMYLNQGNTTIQPLYVGLYAVEFRFMNVCTTLQWQYKSVNYLTTNENNETS